VIKRKASNQRYDRSDKGKVREERYLSSPKGRAMLREKRYRQRLRYRDQANAKDRALIEELEKKLLALCGAPPGAE